jgi:hypothetical protein
MRARIARFSAASASYQVAISSTYRKQPRQRRVAGSIKQIPMQGEEGAFPPASEPLATPYEPLGGSSRSASLVAIIFAL